MADGVQIPVVIDIDKAFEEAAKKVGGAMEPLEKQINKLTKDLEGWRHVLNTEDIGNDLWKVAAKNIQNVSEALAEAEYQLRRYTSNEGSIRQMSADLAELERRWAEMGSAQKFTDSGGKNLSADAQSLLNQYKNITAEIERQGKSLAQLAAEESRINKLKQQGSQSRRYDTAILQSNIKTIRVLSEQQRILSEQLQRTPIGSEQYKVLAARLREVQKELQKAQRDLNGASGSMRNFGSASNSARSSIDATNASLRRQSGLFSQLKSLAGMYISVFGGLRFIQNIRETTAELELQRVALGGILQDTDRATELFREIKAAALKSPFEIKDLVTYTKQLSAYRIETDKLFDVTMRLADVSAGLGVDMSRLILAYGQVRAASVLRGQELRQFTEAGIPLVELLADKFQKLGREGTTVADVFDLISKRAVPFSMIEEIFNDMTDAGGMFYKMQEKQSETLKGQWMKLRDAATIMYDEIGNTQQVHKAMEDLIQSALSLTRNWREIARWVATGAASLVAYSTVSRAAAIASSALAKADAMRLAVSKKQVVAMPRVLAAIVGETTAKELNRKATKRLTIAQYKLAAANGVLEKAFWKVAVAIMKNPYAAAAAGIAAVGFAIYTLVKNSKEAEVSVGSLNSAIAKVNDAASSLAETRRLIDVYEELSTKAEKSAEEQAKLSRVTRELAKSFPSAVNGLNAQGEALDINIEKVKALAKVEAKLAEQRLKRQAEEAKTQLGSLEAEAKRISDNIMQVTEYGGLYLGKNLKGENIIKTVSEEQLEKWGERLREITQLIYDYKTALAKLEEAEFIGPMPKKTDETTQTLSEWKKTIARIQDEKVKAGATPIFTPDDIQKFESVLEFSKALKQEEDKITQSLKTNYELLKTATAETRESIQANIDADEATLKMIKAMRVALGIVFKTTSSRDTRLSQLKSDISELTNAYKKFKELTKYKGEESALLDINKLFPQLEGWTPTKDSLVKKLNEMLDKVKSDLARSPKSKTLLDMKRALETEISNLEFDDLKDKIETKLKNLQDEIKRSETARNFYHNILDLTGDEKLSASLTMEVYGQTGKEFKERVQDEMLGALESAKDLMGKDFFDKMTEDIKIFNVKEIRSQLQLLPETIRPVFERLLNEQEKFEADWYQNYYKVYAKSKDYSDRLADNEKKRAQALKEARERGQDTAAVNAFYDKKAAEIQLEAMKDTYTWTKAFENLEGVSTYTLENLIALIDEYIEKYAKDLGPQQLRELTRSRERAEAQLIERNAFEQLADAMSDYVKAREKKAKLDKDSKEDAEASAQAADDEADALDRASRAMDKAVGYINELASATKELLSAFASDKDASFYSEQIDNLTKSLAGAAQTAQGVMRLITSAGADPAAYVQTFTGVASFITGIVNAINAARIKKANDEIERQARALSDLEYAYGRLDKAIDDAFGNARIYNYNQQIEILKRKIDALNTQLDAERSKRNKASQDAINGYLDSIRETEAALADLQRLPAEFWAGQELTSASEAFVDSWIAAKKEFGDTASAIEETMQEMVENLVSKAAMSGVVQAVLKPWYEELNKIKSWDASTIARMVQEAYNKIPAINQGLEIAYSSLAAAGVDIRRTVGNLTGISRNYATASEESILGLTAATNTQNYYMSYMPTINDHVAAIRARLVGDGGGDTAAAPEGPTYQDQMLIYASNLPLMRSDTEAIRSMLERVIKPAGTTATHYVSVRM